MAAKITKLKCRTCCFIDLQTVLRINICVYIRMFECFENDHSLDYFLLAFDNVIYSDDCVPRSHETQ